MKSVEDGETSEEVEKEMEERKNDEADDESYLDIVKKRRAKKQGERKDRFRELLGLKEVSSEESLTEAKEPKAENTGSDKNTADLEDSESESS